MKCNVGGGDMVVRLVVGVTLLLVGLIVPMSTLWQVVVLVVAAIGLITGLVRYCPVNAALGINSCSEKHKPHQPAS